MHYSRFAVLLAVQSVAATSHKLLPNPRLGVIGDLIGRQDIGSCAAGSTCSECFGGGNILCDAVGCFNPADYQQCCAGGATCVGKDDSCCKDLGGPGVVGKDGVPKTTQTSSAPVSTTSSQTGTTSGGAPLPTTSTDAGSVADINLRVVGAIGSGLGLALLL